MQGVCKLCEKPKELGKSHLIPAALYDLCRPPDSEPVRVTPKVVMQTSRQTQDYLLCRDCEELLNKNGENWMVPLFATIGREFPFYDILIEQAPLRTQPDFTIYSATTNPKISVEQITHFALGVFWKAAVHPWRGNSTEPLIDLGPYEAKLRSFVRGDCTLSQEFALLVTVIPPPVRPICFYEPCENVGGDPGFHIFAFYISGIDFRLAVGKKAAEPRHVICISGGLIHPIFLEDISDTVRTTIRGQIKDAKIARNLSAYLKGHGLM